MSDPVTVAYLLGKRSPAPFENFEQERDRFVKYFQLESAFAIKKKLYGHYIPLMVDCGLIGIEVEVEGVANGQLPLPKFMSGKKDGSLRSEAGSWGVEFVSVPMHPSQTAEALILLWTIFDKMNKGRFPQFSWRTSDHIHVNALDMRTDEFCRFVLLALVFEKLLFQTSRPIRREDSVFCVPLAENTQLELLRSLITSPRELRELGMQWSKYAAVNLRRLTDHPEDHPAAPGIGTVEFRHQAGTKNLARVLLWMATITRLKNAALRISDKELFGRLNNLNTDCQYPQFVDEILGPKIASKFDFSPSYPAVFSRNVSLVKWLLSAPQAYGATGTSSLANALMRDLKKKQEAAKRKEAKRQELKSKKLSAIPSGFGTNVGISTPTGVVLDIESIAPQSWNEFFDPEPNVIGIEEL